EKLFRNATGPGNPEPKIFGSGSAQAISRRCLATPSQTPAPALMEPAFCRACSCPCLWSSSCRSRNRIRPECYGYLCDLPGCERPLLAHHWGPAKNCFDQQRGQTRRSGIPGLLISKLSFSYLVFLIEIRVGIDFFPTEAKDNNAR